MVGAGLVPARMAESHDRSSPIGDPGRDKPCPYSYFVTALALLALAFEFKESVGYSTASGSERVCGQANLLATARGTVSCTGL